MSFVQANRGKKFATEWGAKSFAAQKFLGLDAANLTVAQIDLLLKTKTSIIKQSRAETAKIEELTKKLIEATTNSLKETKGKVPEIKGGLLGGKEQLKELGEHKKGDKEGDKEGKKTQAVEIEFEFKPSAKSEEIQKQILAHVSRKMNLEMKMLETLYIVLTPEQQKDLGLDKEPKLPEKMKMALLTGKTEGNEDLSLLRLANSVSLKDTKKNPASTHPVYVLNFIGDLYIYIYIYFF